MNPTMSMQEKIDSLLSDVYRLFPPAETVFLSDLTELQGRIHRQLTTLHSCHGSTPEEDASLCLALLLGYSVSMYANPDDERRKCDVLSRSRRLLSVLPASSLKERLFDVFNRLTA